MNIKSCIKSKIKFKSFTCILILGFCLSSYGETLFTKSIPLKPGEKWWGGPIVDGHIMPFGDEFYLHNMLGDTKGNQSQPLLISNHGRYIWCDDPFEFEFNEGVLKLSSTFSDFKSGQAGQTLKDAYLHASQTFFPPTGEIPAEILFTHPQYNTWIELMYDQNQDDILKYAESIIKHGFPPGVLMIDDNWQEDYGTWEFKAERFSDPKGMIEKLHAMGFKVMLWVCPFISADSPVYRELKRKRVLMSEDDNQTVPAIVRWWNGASALIDLSNPAGEQWFHQQLQNLVDKYQVDGFKLDAGDAQYYTGEICASQELHANQHTELFAKIGLRFPMNEYRACWKMAGQPLVQRLRDKSHSWNDLRKLIPGILTQGLVGYAYTCPDLIGGGEFRSFLNLDKIDQELIVRSAQCHALMPMMQFSVAPWRVLDNEKMEICREMAILHNHMANEILNLARQSSITSEPIVRHMEYAYPNQGFINIQDQFMLGEDILVAPVLHKNTRERIVQFPEGTWKADDDTIINGPCRITLKAPLHRLPWFKRQ
jgi:alpha-glucosidase (family GH31 glycosyl hydrolase)